MGPSAAPGVGSGAVTPYLACAAWSALSSGSSLHVNCFFPISIWRSNLNVRSATMSRVGGNSQSMGSTCFSRILGIVIARAPSLPILS